MSRSRSIWRRSPPSGRPRSIGESRPRQGASGEGSRPQKARHAQEIATGAEPPRLRRPRRRRRRRGTGADVKHDDDPRQRGGCVSEVHEGDKIVAGFPITPGSTAIPSPKGEWKIMSKTLLPVFRWDKSMLMTGKRSNEFSHHSRRDRTTRWGSPGSRLNKEGIGLHGTNDPETIGRAASHGCIRLANWDEFKLFGMVRKGREGGHRVSRAGRAIRPAPAKIAGDFARRAVHIADPYRYEQPVPQPHLRPTPRLRRRNHRHTRRLGRRES